MKKNLSDREITFLQNIGETKNPAIAYVDMIAKYGDTCPSTDRAILLLASHWMNEVSGYAKMSDRPYPMVASDTDRAELTAKGKKFISA